MRAIKPADDKATELADVQATKPADGEAIEPAAKGAQPALKEPMPTILLASIVGLLGTAAVLGVVAATAGLDTAGWIAGLATGVAAGALLAVARMRSDQPSIHPADPRGAGCRSRWPGCRLV
jgi:hypothetical protein